MSHAYKGLAHVVIASHHLGVGPVETINESVNINLFETAPPNVMRLEFADSVKWPQNANHVTVTLPNGTSLEGALFDFDQKPDTEDWLTFGIDE